MAKYKEMLRQHPDEPIAISDRDATLFLVVSPEYIEGLEATVELLSDPQARRAIARSQADIKAGRLKSHAEARKAVGLE